jgi:hypothetical protein
MVDMVQVIPFEAKHFYEIDVQPAQAYVRDYVTPEHIKSLEGLNSYAAIDENGKLLMCFGFIEIFPTRALMWGFLSATCGNHMTALTRIGKRLLEALPHNRVEIEVDCEFEQGHRWARVLGFELEIMRLKCWRLDGGDSALYSMVRP